MRNCLQYYYRINFETGEQTVLSTHNAPVKSVVYSKEHCEYASQSENEILTSSSIARLSIMGLNSPFSRPHQPLKRAHNHYPPRETPLPLNHRLKTRRRYVIPPPLHLRAPKHHTTSITSQRSRRRAKTLATTRIVFKVHDKSCVLYAER